MTMVLTGVFSVARTVGPAMVAALTVESPWRSRRGWHNCQRRRYRNRRKHHSETLPIPLQALAPLLKADNRP
jgi:hypothetical protein